MPAHGLKIEIFSAPSCSRCDKALQLAQRVLAELARENPENDSLTGNSIELRKLSVVDELDYAVEIGVRATPSIAMNGVLVFTATPSATTLRKAILAHAGIKNQDMP